MESLLSHLLIVIFHISALNECVIYGAITLNLAFIIYWLHFVIIQKETLIGLNLNLFYIFIRNSNKFLLSDEKQVYANKFSEHVKTFLRVAFFLSVYKSAYYIPLHNFHAGINWQFCFEFIYILWSYSCVSKIKNNKDNAFPLIFNPMKRFRFRKRYHEFIKQTYKYMSDCHFDIEKAYATVILDELSARIKEDYKWASSKNIANENTYVASELFHILLEQFKSGKYHSSYGVLNASSGAYEYVLLYNKILETYSLFNVLSDEDVTYYKEQLARTISFSGTQKKPCEKFSIKFDDTVS